MLEGGLNKRIYEVGFKEGENGIGKDAHPMQTPGKENKVNPDLQEKSKVWRK